jgi:hypothetical protein
MMLNVNFMQIIQMLFNLIFYYKLLPNLFKFKVKKTFKFMFIYLNLFIYLKDQIIIYHP